MLRYAIERFPEKERREYLKPRPASAVGRIDSTHRRP
jgi:hypothetical protein